MASACIEMYAAASKGGSHSYSGLYNNSLRDRPHSKPGVSAVRFLGRISYNPKNPQCLGVLRGGLEA